MLKITKKQRQMLWWEEWPYSEAKIIFETRILDDAVSRTFINVEVSINPTTFEICKQNLKKFTKNKMISDLIKSADDRWERFWFVAMSFSSEYDRDDIEDEIEVLQKAKIALGYSEKTIIEMHNFVIDFLEIERFNYWS